MKVIIREEQFNRVILKEQSLTKNDIGDWDWEYIKNHEDDEWIVMVMENYAERTIPSILCELLETLQDKPYTAPVYAEIIKQIPNEYLSEWKEKWDKYFNKA